ncbi:uncharacterized protein EURHEDRAFT_407107 [Aspergillus ruber CBS 135680]|uniref:Uncharacterized protein n=1 Tax=Aspergillus ruber (strain CBS 135680) TaxID=1388766 RepID=A0A017S1Y5_ASPRC|nr:uncharacterized protein EURHEDRAFT_407107 [Aspergillus ruber CBS 135680]EYE90175.1 hypothetical protein EURHEDRAFT_407107 [Aspergillus ruber CBS 135680]
MVKHGDTYKKLQPRDHEAPSTSHVNMIGVIVCTTEDTQNTTNYLGSHVTATPVETIMIKRKWHTTFHNDLKGRTTVALVGIGTVHAEDIYCIQSIQVCTGLRAMKTTA